MHTEKTLIIVKHDGVARGLIGEIIKRFERVGLKLVALEFLKGTDDMGQSHYPDSEKWKKNVGERTLKEYNEKGISAVKDFGTVDPLEIGKQVKKWLVEYLTYGPVLAMIWEGPNAVKIGRKLAGDTVPLLALPGTIRGDFAVDNVELGNIYARPVYNLIHASGEVAEAEDEIKLWFDKDEIFDYKPYASQVMGIYGKMEK